MAQRRAQCVPCHWQWVIKDVLNKSTSRQAALWYSSRRKPVVTELTLMIMALATFGGQTVMATADINHGHSRRKDLRTDNWLALTTFNKLDWELLC